MSFLIRVSNVSTLPLRSEMWLDEYLERVRVRGEKFRDTKTKACLYLASFVRFNKNDTILVASHLPNHDSIDEFAASIDSELGASATHFPIATAGHISSVLNSTYGATGGSLTLSGNKYPLASALMFSRHFLVSDIQASTHLFCESTDRSGEGRIGYATLSYCGASSSRSTGRPASLQDETQFASCSELDFLELASGAGPDKEHWVAVNGNSGSIRFSAAEHA